MIPSNHDPDAAAPRRRGRLIPMAVRSDWGSLTFRGGFHRVARYHITRYEDGTAEIRGVTAEDDEFILRVELPPTGFDVVTIPRGMLEELLRREPSPPRTNEEG